MNKNELVKEMSCRLSISQVECLRYLNVWQDIIEGKLEKGESLILQGFGVFSPWEQTSRLGRNPRTGESCMIRPRTSIKFRPGKRFLTRLNKTV